MLFSVSIQPLPGGQPNFNIQVEAPDLISALEAAKAPILKMARDSQAILAAALPASAPAQPPETPAA